MPELRTPASDCGKPEVPGPELRRLLGCPPAGPLPARVSRLAARAANWYAENGRPWSCTQFFGIEELGSTGVRLHNGTWLRSEELASGLEEAGADQVAVAAVSAGPEAEEHVSRLWSRERPDEGFVLDAYASAMTEQLVAREGTRISQKARGLGRVCLNHRSPGYGNWSLSDQVVLKQLVEDAAGRLPGPLEVLSSGMLRPKKSMLAVFGLSPQGTGIAARTDSLSCSNCDWTPCSFRRTAAKKSGGRGMEAVLPGTPFEYAFSRKALERWSREHLELAETNSGVLAVFHFHGTTCSNLGMPLLLRYEVALAAGRDGYRIRSARCRPAPGDEGFEAMCSYLENSKGLVAGLESDHPLEGCTLNMALEWNPKITPSGCLCKGSDRNHKWRIVLQTIHYALGVKRENAS